MKREERQRTYFAFPNSFTHGIVVDVDVVVVIVVIIIVVVVVVVCKSKTTSMHYTTAIIDAKISDLLLKYLVFGRFWLWAVAKLSSSCVHYSSIEFFVFRFVFAYWFGTDHRHIIFSSSIIDTHHDDHLEGSDRLISSLGSYSIRHAS